MSDLNAVRRRKERLIAYRSQIDEELHQLEQAEELLVKLASVEDDSATVSMAITKDLDGRSAADAAEFVLSRADQKRQGMHFREITSYAVRFGYRQGESDNGADTVRRAMWKHAQRFEPLGAGRFRLRKKA